LNYVLKYTTSSVLLLIGGKLFLFGLFSYLLFNPDTTEPLHYIKTMSLLLSSTTIAMTLVAGCPPLLSPSLVLGAVSKTSKLIYIRFSNPIVLNSFYILTDIPLRPAPISQKKQPHLHTIKSCKVF
jgi:hypothetical protein